MLRTMMKVITSAQALWLALGLCSIGGTVGAQPAGDAITVSGSAAYLQRIALPPEAVLTVRIEDVSRADAPATVLAQVREVFGARQVPIPFALSVPRTAIDARSRYALRASITVGNELRFTTDSHHAVLTQGAADKVDLVLVAVPAVAPNTGHPAALAPTVGFLLPATFAGVLPCADCPGIAHTLTLRADGLYRLRRTFLGKPGEPLAEVGRWTVDASGQQIALGRGESTQRFAVVNGEALHQLDRLGQPIKTAAKLALRRTAQVDAITEPLRWRGELRYMADAASFTDCASGLRWPVATIANYLTAERSYTQSRSAPGAALIVNFGGRLEQRPGMEGPLREHIVIDRFGDAHPGANCDAPPTAQGNAVASLKDTYWKLVELDSKPVPPPQAQQREARITLASGGARLSGFSGCNQLVGAYVHEGSALRFTQMASTRMACVSPFMELEIQVLKMLGAVTGYRIEAQRLSLLGGESVLARFDSVYLR